MILKDYRKDVYTALIDLSKVLEVKPSKVLEALDRQGLLRKKEYGSLTNAEIQTLIKVI